MNIIISAKNLEVTPPLKQYVQKKLGHLEKFIRATEAQVEFDRDPHHHTGQIFHTEANLIVGGKTMHAETRSADAYAAIDLLVPMFREQIGRFIGKKTTIRRRQVRKAKLTRPVAI